MKKKLSIALIIIGISFVLYAIFGRYLVLPGYLQSLENWTSPELMIKYGLQADAESFASNVLIELVLGWCFVLASYLWDKRKMSVNE